MIFYFSGCGNSAIVASRLASLLGEQMQRIEINSPDGYDLSVHKRIIWVFPIYSWGLPPAVKTFISKVKLKGADGLPHFMVATCGDDAGYADRRWQKLMRRRGWKPVAAHTVIMPNTYVCLPGFDTDSNMLASEKIAAAPARVAEIARAVKCRSNISKVVRGKMPLLKTYILYPLFKLLLMSAKPFKSDMTKCSGCGTCSRVCPMGNITMINNRPEWGDRCTMCLACYHSCPSRAVDYGKLSRGKKQYKAPANLPDAANQD